MFLFADRNMKVFKERGITNRNKRSGGNKAGLRDDQEVDGQ